MIKKAKAAEMTQQALVRYIQYSILKPFFTSKQVAEYIREAVFYDYGSVCINPAYTSIAGDLCSGTQVKVCVVCDFPFGLSTIDSRLEQAHHIASFPSVDSIDIISRYALVKGGRYKEFALDLASMAEVIHCEGKTVNVILETDALTESETLAAMSIALAVGADTIKTSSGFFAPSSEGASIRLISKMARESGCVSKIIPTGKIRTQEHFFSLVDLGVQQIGVGYLSAPVVLGLPITSSMSFFFNEILK
ncbi:deoxyribose-phosphate aldolase [Citrobacter freundii]|uniref:deoxyribose-phosphate aldolase n=1 Tax=Citrobacter freundii TaxID=546 RepID=UPI000D6FB312|nr:deoxyribose-phosphate aldolase [Citrobacter freundii]EKV4073079.1 deoxyribose-phosphate aldolase [Citrobacter freundii]EKV5130085.1 deoxyribose-phosphate aldolase [Citrobacter freundii]EKW1510762.1 deoxyribose-phosphate aldolase [Citrobacter freundii]ELZ9359729.1 deoxyribose-phosphate aldolase [Citrobacter freundii]MBD5703322.1 deoxyribose-phosphate aldolase [Citrobacter freundii]